MSNLLYLVVEHGVYRQRIMGAMERQHEAEGRAKRAAAESDGYHSYVIYSIALNASVEDVFYVCHFHRQYKWAGGEKVFLGIERHENQEGIR